MNHYNTILLVFITLVQVSCSTKGSVERIVREWHGKKIEFPTNIDQMIVGKKNVNNDFLKEYKILVYKDSSSCNTCYLHLAEWTGLMAEIKEVSNVALLFFVNSLTKEEAFYLKAEQEFYYPIIVDELDILNNLNHFPDNPNFHCFLLNRFNEVLLVGDPCNSAELWELYKKTILAE